MLPIPPDDDDAHATTVSDGRKRATGIAPRKVVASAIGVLLLIVVGLRGCDLHQGTRTVDVKGSGSAVYLASDTEIVTDAAAKACKPTGGWLGHLVTIHGPSDVVVVERAASGSVTLWTVDCKTGDLLAPRSS